MTASIAGYKPAQPFCPMVVPKEAEKLAIDSGTPKRLVCASIFNGILAALERLVKAKLSTGQTFLKNCTGLTPLMDKISACTINIMAKPT